MTLMRKEIVFILIMPFSKPCIFLFLSLYLATTLPPPFLHIETHTQLVENKIFFSITVLLNSYSGAADIVLSKYFVVTCVNNIPFTGFGVVEFKLEDWTL